MAVMLGTIIISLQILAHLPLLNITFTAKSFEAFKIMMQIVSFDYFPIHEIIDFGFMETDAWSENFGFLGYDSLNFVEGMGSISLFLWLLILYLILTAIWHFIKWNCRICENRAMMTFMNPIGAFHTSLAFVQGVYVETLICVCVGMSMLQFKGYFTAVDTFSVVW